MKQSARAKRMLRNHKRQSQVTRLSLISLMDIFTILVFFLMVNTSEVQVMQNNKQLNLPKSVSEQVAADNLVITITADYLLVQGQQIITLSELTGLSDNLIAPLAAELDYQKGKRGQLTEQELADGLGINIMADQTIAYAVLKKVMHTASASGYSNISLAVSQIPSPSEQAIRAAITREETGE